MEIIALPTLRKPVLIAAFEGWNDAGSAASAAVEHLIDVWDAQEIAYFDPEDYYDFQVNRPLVQVTESQAREIEWPTTSISVATPAHLDRDFVIVRGIEPSMRWRTFCEELIGIIDDLEVELVVTLGALIAEVPHTRPIHILGSGSDSAISLRYGLQPSRYEGPTGIVGVLQNACMVAGIDALSLWAQVPHYVSQPPCPKASLALVNRLDDLLGVRIPIDDLQEEATAWELGVNQLSQEDNDVAQYVHGLEEQQDAAELPEASGDAIARDFERYLRRREES
jgi:hypothetical protein